MVDDITGSGRGRSQRVKGLDRGCERRSEGSGEDSTTARAPGKFLLENFGSLMM
jgi:hypothetical protein